MSPAERAPVKVVCADDHPVFRRALCDLVAATPGFVEIGAAASGGEALALTRALRPDVLLLDVHMPGMSGIDAGQILTSERRDLLVVLISADRAQPTATSSSRSQLVFIPKQDLCSRLLLDAWHGRRTR